MHDVRIRRQKGKKAACFCCCGGRDDGHRKRRPATITLLMISRRRRAVDDLCAVAVVRSPCADKRSRAFALEPNYTARLGMNTWRTAALCVCVSFLERTNSNARIDAYTRVRTRELHVRAAYGCEGPENASTILLFVWLCVREILAVALRLRTQAETSSSWPSSSSHVS